MHAGSASYDGLRSWLPPHSVWSADNEGSKPVLMPQVVVTLMLPLLQTVAVKCCGHSTSCRRHATHQGCRSAPAADLQLPAAPPALPAQTQPRCDLAWATCLPDVLTFDCWYSSRIFHLPRGGLCPDKPLCLTRWHRCSTRCCHQPQIVVVLVYFQLRHDAAWPPPVVLNDCHILVHMSIHHLHELPVQDL